MKCIHTLDLCLPIWQYIQTPAVLPSSFLFGSKLHKIKYCLSNQNLVHNDTLHNTVLVYNNKAPTSVNDNTILAFSKYQSNNETNEQ